MLKTSKWVDALHNRIKSNESPCNELDSNACSAQTGNYILFLVSLALSKIADAFASAKVVLPWLMASTGAPVFLISLLVPIRESGSMLPQIFLGAYIKRQATRKYYLVYGALLQAFVVIGLVVVALTLNDKVAGVSIIALTILFSLSRAVTSIANKDVMGKTIDKNKRGTLSGTAASIAGAFILIFGGVLYFRSNEHENVALFLSLSALCFVFCAISYALLKEYDGSKSDTENPIDVAKNNLSLLTSDTDFKRFVWVRSLMICSGLTAPYLVLLVQQQEGSSYVSLATFILLAGVASLISGRIWGQFSDKNSKRVMTFSACLNTLICFVTICFIWFDMGNVYAYFILFFFLLIVHEGVRQSRKTYIIDMTGGNKRTDYVSVSNSVIGVVLLVLGLFSGALAQYSLMAVLVFFMVLSLIAATLSLKLKQVSKLN